VVLYVSPLIGDHLDLQRIFDGFEGTSWVACKALSCREALVQIAQEQPDVVLCEAALPDGNWKQLLEVLAGQRDPPYLIVTSRLADDRMWAEVLNLGGYDVLAKPFDPVEIYRVIGFACQRRQELNRRRCRSESGGTTRDMVRTAQPLGG
jgi:DNA-binding response OmpR family regulator